MLLKHYKIVIVGAALAAAAYSFLPSHIGKWEYRIDRGERQKNIYLTFDDGPGSYTAQLLDLLQKYNIKASFFVVARSAAEHPDLIVRMKKEGHLIGAHSLDHRSAMLQTPEQTRRDMAESIGILRKLGADVKYYRPPWGHVNLETLRQIRKMDITRVLWHVMVQDWRADTTAEEILYKLLKRTGRDDIICLHDGRGKKEAPARMMEALEAAIQVWQKDGWQFKRLDERKGDILL